MIVVRLMGGLGNQLFQYAAARHLAHLNNTELYLDIKSLENTPTGETIGQFELDKFNINAKIADESTLKSFLGCGFTKKDKFMTQFFSVGRRKKYEFNNYGFDEHLLNLHGNYYIKGFFQSEKYFKDIASIISQELEVKKELININQEIIDEIKSKNSVSIHIRRGDHAKNLTSMDAHSLCSKDYFKKSIKYMKENVGANCKFYLFTDDKEWVKNEMTMDENCELISGNSTIEDFYLMSLCKHNIISNSTYSWWAAWLNMNPEKIVVMPKYWTNHLVTEEIKLKPKNWIVK